VIAGAAGALQDSRGATQGAPAPPAPAQGTIRVQIGATSNSRPIPPGFVGLSIEYRSAPGYFGTPTDPDDVFDQLVRNVTPGQSPVLRFGGDTTDWTWAPTPGVARPPGIQYTLSPSWMQDTQAAARALDARLILGINFESDSGRVAAAEAAALLGGVGTQSVAGLELGNEPELYGSLGWYDTPAGIPVPGRPASYGFRAYLRDYANVSRALPLGVPLVGPASGSTHWPDLGTYLTDNPRVGLATFHRYPLHRCYTPRSSPDFPTIANLLAPAASTGPATSLTSAVAVAHARGIPLRADELNSVSCGGARGVSDTFASALWVVDALFNMARVGVDGVNIETFHNAFYEPFDVTDSDGVWSAQVRPLYYGMLMFTEAAPTGARLEPVTSSGPPTLRVWSTRDPAGRLRVVLINDSRSRAATVAVHPPGSAATAGRATAIQLLAPDADATAAVTIGGQSFGATTATGSLIGTPTSVSVPAVRGAFVTRVPPASATLLTVDRG
jgi:hypothetical protein